MSRTILISLLFDLLCGLIAWFEEQTRAFLGIGLVSLPFYLVPIDLIGTLGKGNMGNQTAVADEDNSGNLASLDGLIAAIIDLTRLIVNPLAFWQIDHALIA